MLSREFGSQLDRKKLTTFAGLMLTGCAMFFCSPDAEAQSLNELWVNPQTGDDVFGVGSMSAPFKTISTAMNAALPPTIIRALPGYYSDDPSIGNGEVFPIRMRAGVHLQGVGAKECVLRKLLNPGESGVSFFVPVKTRGAIQNNMELILDFSLVNSELEASVEGFTFQGSDIQVGTWAERSQIGRISNCVFDMRGGSSFAKPEFGILLVPIFDLSAPPPHYNPLTYFIFNNTFIQGYRVDAEGTAENASPSSVALCNVNDPADLALVNDPGPLRGVSDLHVQNNLFRHLVGAKRTSMLGVDYGDTTIAPFGGSQSGPTNAFDPQTVGGANGKYNSQILPVPSNKPIAKVVINQATGVGVDPGFIGEMISQKQVSLLTNPHIRDWRLLPDSALVDQGSAPIYNGASAESLTAVNGVVYFTLSTSPISSFDWDGEGHGNARWVANHPDIGFDETDIYTVAGGYGNDSKSHDAPFDPTIQVGNSHRTLIFPQTGLAQLWFTQALYTPGIAWRYSPGTTPGISGSLGVNYLNPGTTLSMMLPSPVTNTWTNPVDGNVHTWAELIFNSPNGAGQPIHFNQQVLFTPAGGSSTVISNLQFEIF